MSVVGDAIVLPLAWSGKPRISANVSIVHDVPEPGEARRRHVRAFPGRYPFTVCAARPRAQRGRGVK
jgi:hypothetical protein